MSVQGGNGLVLLKFPGKEGDVFFLLRSERSDPKDQSHIRYCYEEHSCPINWVREVIGVIMDGDTDPHGFLEFVRAIETPTDFDENDEEAWPLLFPEAFGGKIIEGEKNVTLALKGPEIVS